MQITRLLHCFLHTHSITVTFLLFFCSCFPWERGPEGSPEFQAVCLHSAMSVEGGRHFGVMLTWRGSLWMEGMEGRFLPPFVYIGLAAAILAAARPSCPVPTNLSARNMSRACSSASLPRVKAKVMLEGLSFCAGCASVCSLCTESHSVQWCCLPDKSSI